jgi:multiple sugar transport system ATP-binding protein
MVVMRDGKVAQVGTPAEVYATPNSVFVATFVGSPKMNILKGSVTSGTFTSTSGLSGKVSQSHSGEVLLGLRPEDVTVTASPTGHAVIEQIELLGPRAVVTLKLGEDKVVSVVEAGPLAALSTGAKATLSFAPSAAHLFDATTEDRI